MAFGEFIARFQSHSSFSCSYWFDACLILICRVLSLPLYTLVRLMMVCRHSVDQRGGSRTAILGESVTEGKLPGNATYPTLVDERYRIQVALWVGWSSGQGSPALRRYLGTGGYRALGLDLELKCLQRQGLVAELPAFLHRSPTSVGCATFPGCLPSTSPSLKYCCSALLCSGLVLAYEHSPVVMMCREGGWFLTAYRMLGALHLLRPCALCYTRPPSAIR